MTRMARCSAFGRKPGALGSRDCPAVRDGGVCQCERVSAEQPAMFEANPDEPFDTFYCGCSCGWD